MVVIPHPLYSPDLAPCDFFLFPKMKLKGHWFDTMRRSRLNHTVLYPDKKGLHGSVPKMEETVELVSTSKRELLRG
jgi:hypothetical protein